MPARPKGRRPRRAPVEARPGDLVLGRKAIVATQLEEAIRLFLSGRGDGSIGCGYLLASAASEILDKIALPGRPSYRRRLRERMEAVAGPGSADAVLARMVQPYNALKHASSDPDETVALDPDAAALTIFFSVDDFVGVFGYASGVMQLFSWAYGTLRPQLLRPDQTTAFQPFPGLHAASTVAELIAAGSAMLRQLDLCMAQAQPAP